MKKILLLFCLGSLLSFPNSLFSQNDCPASVPTGVCDASCNIGEDMVQAGAFGFGFVEPGRRSGDAIEVTETEFFSDDFIVGLVDTTMANVRATCDATATVRVRRPSRFRRNESTSRSNNTILFTDTIIFSIESGGDCDGHCLILNVSVIADPDPIPTLSQWGLIIFGLLVLNLGIGFILEKREILSAALVKS